MKFISLLFIATLFSACSSEPANNARTNTNSNSKPAAVSPMPAVPASASSATTSSVIPSAPIVSDGKVPLPEVEGTPVPTPDPSQAPSGLGTTTKRGKPMVDQPATGPAPQPKPVPAGENSEVTTTMDRLGRFVETRVFKGHAQLVKAERVWVDANGSVLTLTLKNGKQVRGSGAAIQNMMAATAVDLMLAVGMKLADADPSSTGARQ